MIPFFRKIRKKMADDNRPLKYARYAIGEIILVVIGILIALQVNNWNEDRKLEKSEASYYRGLINDLRKDSLDLVWKIHNAERNIIKLNNILSFIDNDYDITRADIVSLEWDGTEYKDTLMLFYSLSQAGFVQFPQTFDNTIMDLRNTGNLKLLKNEKLKDDILVYYNMRKLNDSWSQVFLMQRREIESVVDGILDKNLRSAYTLKISFEQYPLDYEAFLEKIKNKPALEALAIGMLHVQRRIVRQAKFGSMKVDRILQDLYQELKK